jgi:hypothetical protein
MAMNWEAIGSVAELLGAMAVLFTFGYLAIQIKQNTKALDDNSTNETFRSFSGYRHLLADPEIADLYVRGLDSYTSLTESEKIQFQSLLEEYFFACGVMNTKVERGLGGFRGKSYPFDKIFAKEGGRDWWCDSKEKFEAQFVAEVEQRFPVLKNHE